MSSKTSLVIAFVCLFVCGTKAQNCDPWITKIYRQYYGVTPNSTECNIRLYNNGSWNGYDQLKGFIRGYMGNYASSTPLAKQNSGGNCANNNYQGICVIADFTNDDFPKNVTTNTCGQAAAVSAMWHAGLNTKYPSAQTLVTEFYNSTPPKITIGGLVEYKNSLGTDWRQLESGLNKYASKGIRYNWQKGKSALQNELRKGNVCIIMIDMGPIPPYKWGGHWVTAFGYDAKYVYVTNMSGFNTGQGNKITWDQLHKAWGGSLTEGHLARLHGKTEEFATVWME